MNLDENRVHRIQAFREDLRGVFDFWDLTERLDHYSFNLQLKLSELIFDGALLVFTLFLLIEHCVARNL